MPPKSSLPSWAPHFWRRNSLLTAMSAMRAISPAGLRCSRLTSGPSLPPATMRKPQPTICADWRLARLRKSRRKEALCQSDFTRPSTRRLRPALDNPCPDGDSGRSHGAVCAGPTLTGEHPWHAQRFLTQNDAQPMNRCTISIQRPAPPSKFSTLKALSPCRSARATRVGFGGLASPPVCRKSCRSVHLLPAMGLIGISRWIGAGYRQPWGRLCAPKGTTSFRAAKYSTRTPKIGRLLRNAGVATRATPVGC